MMAPGRVIYYSVVSTDQDRCFRQWMQSIRSLRRHNSSIPVHLFHFNPVSSAFVKEADRYGVSIHTMGSYREWLSKRSASHSHELSSYPTLHNLLVSTELISLGASQVLYVDCDTFFFGDPANLFEQYGQYDWCAREMPGTRLSDRGQTSNLDEEMVSRIAALEGLRMPTPYNTGVCLLSASMLDAIKTIERTFVDYAWRLMTGLHLSEFRGFEDVTFNLSALTAKSGWHLERLRALHGNATYGVGAERALPYPSDNWWILPEIAWLLALGCLPNLSEHVFDRSAVIQGDEFMLALESDELPVIAHYFSTFESDFWGRVARIA